jgi:hypothetical protein
MGHSQVWTGQEMLIWGGRQLVRFGVLLRRRRYDPATDDGGRCRRPVRGPAVGVFGDLDGPGDDRVGGRTSNIQHNPVDTGGRYDPAADRWVPTSTAGAPSPRAYNTAVWTGQEMIVFGGITDGQKSFGDGGRYNPAADVWTAVSLQDAPPPRWYHGAVWTGSEMLVWGGDYRDGAPVALSARDRSVEP